jgi:hypothetical protein
MQVTLPATQGRFADPMHGARLITFGDPCPGCESGIAVHEPIIAAISADGDVILPQFYALCCDCHHAQHLMKHGDAPYAQCDDEQVNRDLKLMNLPPQPIGIGSGQVTQIA